MTTHNKNHQHELHDLALEEAMSESSHSQPTKRSKQTKAVSQPTSGHRFIFRTLASLLILMGSGFLLSAFVGPHDLSQQSEAASQGSLNSSSPAVAPQADVFRPIEQVQVGDRVAGKNPLQEQVWHVTPEPETWRKVSLKMRKPSGKLLQIELLRPLDWIENSGASVGQSIHLDLEELGAVGDAKVTAIATCPRIKPGKGTIVTGTFTHEVDEQTQVLSIRLEGEIDATGVTDNHPYWSETRQAFITAGQLAVGEKVNTRDGIREIDSIEPCVYQGLVHNMETLEHVYRVGAIGTLVHNTYERTVYRVMDLSEYKYARKGQWADSSNAIDGVEEAGAKYVWKDKDAAMEWLDLVSSSDRSGSRYVLTEIPTANPTSSYNSIQHISTPYAEMFFLPFEELGPAKAIFLR